MHHYQHHDSIINSNKLAVEFKIPLSRFKEVFLTHLVPSAQYINTEYPNCDLYPFHFIEKIPGHFFHTVMLIPMQFFWNIFFQKSLELYYASNFHYQNLASSPSFCEKQIIFKIVKKSTNFHLPWAAPFCNF